MSDLITRTARLVPYSRRPKQVPSFVTAYAYEPLPDDPGAELGNLYVVIEVLITGRASEEVADLIIETIGDRYYNHAQTGTAALERFESAVKATNQELAEHVNRGNAAWIGKLSAVIAVHLGEELHVAQTGSAEAFLYRGKAVSHISANASSSRPTTPSKTFGSIASGQLEAGDRLLLATPALVHQVPLTRLQSIISQSGPNAAIAELTDLLKGTTVDRIAALIIEITTPELAALQVRSEQPAEIRLGTPETALQAAKLAAAPIAQSTVSSSKRMAKAAHTSFKQAEPQARRIIFTSLNYARHFLSSNRNRTITLGCIAATIVLVIGVALRHQTDLKNDHYWTDYQAIYTSVERAQQLARSGNKVEARDAFTSSLNRLSGLKDHQAVINHQLQRATTTAAEPRSFSALTTLIQNLIDQIDGLITTKATTVASLPGKNDHAEHFELSGQHAYVFDETTKQLLIINVLTGESKPSSIDLGKLGPITATALSANSDGIYITTSKPAVWFYRFDSDAITSQTVTYGQWPLAKAIASYGPNLYLLTDTSLYKHVKSAAGFSPKTEYLSLSTEANRDASAIAVTGDVYIFSPSGLHRYVSNSLKQSAASPSGLGRVINLRTSANNDLLIGTNPANHRVGLWTLHGNELAFQHQIEITNVAKLYDALINPDSTTVYGLADGRIIRVNTPL